MHHASKGVQGLEPRRHTTIPRDTCRKGKRHLYPKSEKLHRKDCWDGNRFSMAKLNNNNYSSWRFKVELLLVQEELWHHVEPGVKPANVDQAIWDAGVAKTRAIIGLLIDDNQHGLIRNSTTAREAWLSLQNHHRKSTLTSKVSLLKRDCYAKFFLLLLA